MRVQRRRYDGVPPNRWGSDPVAEIPLCPVVEQKERRRRKETEKGRGGVVQGNRCSTGGCKQTSVGGAWKSRRVSASEIDITPFSGSLLPGNRQRCVGRIFEPARAEPEARSSRVSLPRRPRHISFISHLGSSFMFSLGQTFLSAFGHNADHKVARCRCF